MIDLYTAPTPNGWKASIALEELGLAYDVKVVNILAGERRRRSTSAGVAIDDLPHLSAWHARMSARPACQRGVEVPFKLQVDEKTMAQTARTILQR